MASKKIKFLKGFAIGIVLFCLFFYAFKFEQSNVPKVSNNEELVTKVITLFDKGDDIWISDYTLFIIGIGGDKEFDLRLIKDNSSTVSLMLNGVKVELTDSENELLLNYINNYKDNLSKSKSEIIRKKILNKD
jgi:hypothetical protein